MDNTTTHNKSSQIITKIVAAVCIVVVIVIIVFSAINSQNSQTSKSKPSTGTTVIPTIPLEQVLMQVQPTQLSGNTSPSIIHVTVDSGAVALTGVQFGLRYDPTSLSLQQVSPTALLPHHQVLFDVNDAKTGILTFAEFITPNASPVKGSGSAADVTFSIKNPQGNLKVSLVPSKTMVTSPGLTLRPVSGSDSEDTVSVRLSSRSSGI